MRARNGPNAKLHPVHRGPREGEWVVDPPADNHYRDGRPYPLYPVYPRRRIMGSGNHRRGGGRVYIDNETRHNVRGADDTPVIREVYDCPRVRNCQREQASDFGVNFLKEILIWI